MSDDRPDAAKRLEQARLARGFETAKDAARYFGWTYESYIQHENGTRGLSRAAGRYAKSLKVSEGWLLTGEGQGPGVDSNNLVKSSRPLGLIKVSGKVAANTWLSVDDMDFDYSDVEYVPSVDGFPLHWQFALVVEGNCLNKRANHGDKLVVLDIIKAEQDVFADDLVIVERKKFGGQMVERTAKRVRQAADGFELWPESTDPAHQEPIRLYKVPEGEEIQIIGKVLWIMRRP